MSKSKELHIVIVEDDKMVMNVLEEFIYKMNHINIVATSDSVRSAKATLKENHADLVLLDISLPDGTGLDILKWIREESLNIDAIMLTADQRTLSIETAKRYGVYDYILKPFKFDRLQEAFDKFQQKKNILANRENIQQSMVDNIMADRNIQGNWQNQTYELILDYLRNHSDQSYTSSEIAGLVGISRVTARKYLESMELEGSIILEMSYGNVGRPKNKYRYERN